ncbi:MAG TPA: glycogen debranching N-terminal domain-containing protein [Capillimicrobium sp.]|nr:glycogen debranching N-terminal domain-containing protein [Capillimicrobium sp.]
MAFADDPAAHRSAVTAADVEGAPSVPAEAREDLLALKSGATFLCARRDGDVVPGAVSGEGLYTRDTRHLSELRLTLGGALPVLLSSTMESGHEAVVHATNPELVDRAGAPIPQDTLAVRRRMLVADALHYAVAVRAFGPRPVATTASVTFGADFADVFEVRRFGRRTGGRLLAPAPERDGVRLAYVAADGERRETLVELSPPPVSVTPSDGGVVASWDVELAPGEELGLLVTVTPSGGGDGARPRLGAEAALRELAEAQQAWVESCASISTDYELFDRLVEASMRDVHALMMPLGASRLPAAGIPWYVAPFGRDSLIASLETLMLNPDIARATLLALAPLQADADEAWRDAEPGKILHELRTGELARTGVVPHTPYYGTVDATPLFLMVAGRYVRWTDDLETMERLRPALYAAVAWIDEWGDRDGDGFVEYERRSPGGLSNQGWKDSEDAIAHADGTLAEGPIALVEAQAYVYDAKLNAAMVLSALGDDETADRLIVDATTLREAFDAAFWDPDEGYYALALDGRKRQVRSVASNAAHALFCGIADPEKAARVAERLMAADMYSGWGIRTLSASARAFNPMSYHNGSVWPHDNAIAAAGLKRYGFDVESARIAGGLLDVAAGARDFRLPELFCGFGRDESRAIVAYPVACIPQAWAAAAPFMLLQVLLGLWPDAPGGQLRVQRPWLPEWLGAVELGDVRIGSARASLGFRRGERGGTGFTLLEQHGDVQVTMAA